MNKIKKFNLKKKFNLFIYYLLNLMYLLNYKNKIRIIKIVRFIYFFFFHPILCIYTYIILTNSNCNIVSSLLWRIINNVIHVTFVLSRLFIILLYWIGLLYKKNQRKFDNYIKNIKIL